MLKRRLEALRERCRVDDASSAHCCCHEDELLVSRRHGSYCVLTEMPKTGITQEAPRWGPALLMSSELWAAHIEVQIHR